MRKRKLMAQINVVPFIDVILVLLIVFMIATPSMRTGEVELPSVGQALSPTQANPIEVTIRANGNIVLAEGGSKKATLTRTQAVDQVLALQVVKVDGTAEQGRPVVIAADKNVRYDEVVSLLGALHAAGVRRVGLAAKESN